MKTTDKAVTQLGGCVSLFWFGLGGLFLVGIAYVIARWTGVIILALIALVWYFTLRGSS
jgi:hypothetical protein